MPRNLPLERSRHDRRENTSRQTAYRKRISATPAHVLRQKGVGAGVACSKGLSHQLNTRLSGGIKTQLSIAVLTALPKNKASQKGIPRWIRKGVCTKMEKRKTVGYSANNTSIFTFQAGGELCC